MNVLIRRGGGARTTAIRYNQNRPRVTLTSTTTDIDTRKLLLKSKKCKIDSSLHHPALNPFYPIISVVPTPAQSSIYCWCPTSAAATFIIPPLPISAAGQVRYFSVGQSLWETSSSKVEESVKKIQEKEKEKETPKSDLTIPKTAVVKKSIGQRVWAEMVHYYHGFRLLFLDINVARKLVGKVLSGKTLTRREYTLLIRTTGDVFRLVPFSVFIIVPFMELLLPVFIKFFPGMLPSTFQTAKDVEDKARKNLKVKLEMAKFLQKTLDEMDVSNKDHRSEEAKEFIMFFNKLRTAGERATPEEIMKFSKLFEDEITLDSLTHEQLMACCKVLEVQTFGTPSILRFQLRMKLRNLAADDRMIQKEGVDSLTLGEMQAASRARGMRSYGLSKDQLKNQLMEWINLSLNEKVPPSLLLLSRAMLLPEDVSTADKLKASISVLSESAAIQTKAAIGEREGKIDNKSKIDVIRDEQRKIKEELEELKETEQVQAATAAAAASSAADVLVDKAPIINAEEVKPQISVVQPVAATPAEPAAAQPIVLTAAQISSKDIETMSNALDAIAAEKKTLLVEKEEIKDLKEEIADYKEDVEELNLVSQHSESATQIKQSSASKILLKKVDQMVTKLDKVMEDLEKKEAVLKADIKKASDAAESKINDELIRIDELIVAIRRMQTIPDESKVETISKMLGKIDADKDGQLKVDDVLKIIETIGKDSVDLTEKQVDELIELITKEEHLENEEKIEKALAKSKETQAAAAATTTPTTGAKKDPEIIEDKAKVLSDEAGQQDPKLKSASKIDERINEDVMRSAADAAERQKEKIIPLAVGNEMPKTPQLPTSAGSAVGKKDGGGPDKML